MAEPASAARRALEQAQLAALQSLLAAVVPANSFYTGKLAAARVSAGVSSLADFSQRFPCTLKSELVEDQRVHPPFGSNLTSPLARYTRCHQTSGTTGAPLRWLDTPESWAGMVQSWMAIYRAAGVTPGARVCFAFSFGPFLGFWLAFEAAEKLGCLCLPGGGMSSAARVRAVLEHGATVLCCTPTYALRLAEAAAAEQLDLRAGPVRTLIVAGEPGGSLPATRARLEQAWPGARVFDHHGMTEVGPVTHECPARPCVLHILETAYLAEVIDPRTGAAVAAGQTGELVLTTLGRIASPVLRYRTGDLVQRESRPAPCACGSWAAALPGGILGRTDDMVVVRGVNVYPNAVEEIVRAFPEITEYQVRLETVKALTEVSVQIEVNTPDAGGCAVAARLEKAFQTALSLRVPVRVTPAGSLPRSELKSRRWVRS